MSSCTPIGSAWVADAPTGCSACSRPLCLRKQVINLALGNTDEMLCLECLAKENGRTPDELLQSMKSYALSRECFRKEWIRYENERWCPDPEGCYPALCFDLGRE